jgi:hypothetical protein
MASDVPRVLVEPECSPVPAVVAGLLALGLATVVVAFTLDNGISVLERICAGGVGFLVALTVAGGSHRLAVERGGVFLEGGGTRLGIGLTSPSDIWWIPVEQVLGVRAVRQESTDEDALLSWTACVELEQGLSVVIAESIERDLVESIVRGLAEKLCVEIMAEPPKTTTPRSGEVSLRVHKGVAFHAHVFLFGITLITVGLMLFTQLSKAPVLGFLFGPLFTLLGFALTGIVIAKRLYTEELHHQGGLWSQVFTLGPLRWGKRVVSSPRPVWSLRSTPIRGARLEMAGEDGVLILGSGATTQSRDNIEKLVSVPSRFAGS